MNNKESKKVLFICTGNYYRSRFAEILFNHLSQQNNLRWRAESKGFSCQNPENIGPISVYAAEGLSKRGIELTDRNRYPQKLEIADLESSAIIIALKRDEHLPYVLQGFKEWQEKIIFWDINDVEFESPDSALASIEIEIKKLISELEYLS